MECSSFWMFLCAVCFRGILRYVPALRHSLLPMVRVNINANGSIKQQKPKLDDRMAKNARHAKKHRDKERAKRMLLKKKLMKEKLMKERLMKERLAEAKDERLKKHSKIDKHRLEEDSTESDSDSDSYSDNEDDIDNKDDIDMDDDSLDSESFDLSSESSSSGDEADNKVNPFATDDIDRQLRKKIKPIKSLDMPKKKVSSKLNMEIVSKDYVDICTQIHALSKSLKVDKADKKIIANLIYYYIKYFLYSCCIKKKPVFDWLEEFKDKIHIY